MYHTIHNKTRGDAKVVRFQNIFHTGYLARDVASEMAALSEALGLRWAKPYVYEALTIWTPDRDVHQIRLEVAYSADGPQRVEIQKGPAGSIYDPELHNAHHLGIWVEEVSTAAAPMLAQGWSVVVSALPPHQGFGTFAYLRPPREGMLIELVNLAAKPRFERWWGGADGPF
nr:VOC family protein [Sphingobium lactosutens]